MCCLDLGAAKWDFFCHTLNREEFKLRNREEATKSLYKLLGFKNKAFDPATRLVVPTVNEREALFKTAYAKAVLVATTPDDWDALDYIMSQYPPDVRVLEQYYMERRGPV